LAKLCRFGGKRRHVHGDEGFARPCRKTRHFFGWHQPEPGGGKVAARQLRPGAAL
jgi:hypothetical protein